MQNKNIQQIFQHFGLLRPWQLIGSSIKPVSIWATLTKRGFSNGPSFPLFLLRESIRNALFIIIVIDAFRFGEKFVEKAVKL